jgi:uncharacterized protein
MTAESNVATIERIYKAFGEGDVDTILAACSDDVDWATDAASTDAPWWGNRHGKDEVVGFFIGIGESTDVTEFEVVSIASTENEVLAFLRYSFTSRQSGESARMHLHHYFRFDHEGKLEYVRSSEDTQLVAATLAGQPARSTSAVTS